jgi:PAS domain S-box-containing protein
MANEPISTDTRIEESPQGERIFRLLVSGVKDYAIFMLDPNGIVMTWNDGAQRIKGYKASEIIGKHFSQFYTQEAKDSRHPENELEIAIKEGQYEEEGWRVRKDGSLMWAQVTITTMRNEERELIGFAKVTRDLTERKQAEQQRDAHSKQLAQSEKIFRLLVSGVKDYAIFMLSPEGYVLTWNEGAQRIKGYSASEIIGKHFSQFYTKEAKDIEHPQKELDTATKEGRYEEEGWRVRKDGTTFWASVVITAVRDDQGQLIGFAKVTRDLTERRLSEKHREANAKQLAETNVELQLALDAKDRFLSTVSHEVRTPMAVIIGMTEILTLQDFGKDNNTIIQNIFQSCKRLLQLLNNVLETARMHSGNLRLEPRKFAVRAALGDIRQLIAPDASKKNLAVVGFCDAAIPEMLCGDEMRLRQILLNLAFNAVKFTEKGEINIACNVKEESDGKTIVRFTIRDTGIGISPEDQTKIFKPFSQVDVTPRSLTGTGLGLSICKDLVELMGGKIGVQSELGKGSTFWFDIPFSASDCE